MPTGRLFRIGVVALLAPAGVLSGHALTYLLAIPDPVRRAAVLADTGHEWWTSAVPLGAVLAVGGILWVLAGRLRYDAADESRSLASWLAPRLAVCQLVLFAAVEVTERFVTGHSLGEVLQYKIIEHGFLAQVVVALLLTALCWCLSLTVERACRGIDRPSVWSSARPARLIGCGWACPRSRLRRPPSARAPPMAS